MPEERLNDQEFRELMPYLKLEDLFMIEIKEGDNWLNLYEDNGSMGMRCNACKVNFSCKLYHKHIKGDSHKHKLEAVQLYYQSKYTFPKAGNQKLDTQEEQKKYSQAKVLVKKLSNSIKHWYEDVFNKRLRALAMRTEARELQQVCVLVGLPLATLLQVQYVPIPGNKTFQPLLKCDTQLQQNARFYCNLCSKFCAGVISLNSHLSGNQHMTRQLQNAAEVRHTKYRFITKNCRYNFAKKLFVTVSENNAKSLYGAEVRTQLIRDGIHEPSSERSKSVEKKQDEASKSKRRTETEATTEGLIGVEYILKLVSKGEDVYECVLCKISYNERKMLAHLVSHEHRLKYCDLHYTDTMKKYKDDVGHMKYQDFVMVMTPLLAKMAAAIEKVHSRAVPAELKEEQFIQRRTEYINEVFGYRHASQHSGPSFSKAVTLEDIKNFKRNKPPYKPRLDNLDFNKAPKIPYLEVHSYNQTDRLNRGLSREYKKSTSEETKVPNFNEEVAREERKIERIYDSYRREPEKHPLYEQEWNRFWKQRKDELIAEGIDHRTYNYQAEWVHYFKNRLEELYCYALQQMKEDVKRKLHLDVPIEKVVDIRGVEEPPLKMPRFIVHVEKNEHRISNVQTTIQQPLPDKPNVIHVLRLMTAVEDHLGSLGAKIMDMFSKALQLEKKCGENTNLLERCILTPDNCNLLEVTMEKLKGVLFAELLDANKSRAFTKVIKYTEELLQYAENNGFRSSEQEMGSSLTPTLQQKSLSDTLKELMAGKMKEKSRDEKHDNFRNSNNSNQMMDYRSKPTMNDFPQRNHQSNDLRSNYNFDNNKAHFSDHQGNAFGYNRSNQYEDFVTPNINMNRNRTVFLQQQSNDMNSYGNTYDNRGYNMDNYGKRI